MFGIPKEPTPLEKEIDHLVLSLKAHAVGSEEYLAIVNQIIVLNDLQAKMKPAKLSKETMAVVGGNLLGILMIIKHEHVNVITSRAMNLVLKSK